MFVNRKRLDRYLSHQFDLLNELLEDLHEWEEELRETMEEFKKDSNLQTYPHLTRTDIRFLKQDVAEAQRLVDEKRNHIKKVINDHRRIFPDLLGESIKSNRHVSHLGGLGSGDGFSTGLNQDMNPPKISGGGFTGTADAKFSERIGQKKSKIDTIYPVMFPENEESEEEKLPKNKSHIKEGTNMKKRLIDLFDDKFFEAEEEYTHFKEYDTSYKFNEKARNKKKEQAFEEDVNNALYPNAIDYNNKVRKSSEMFKRNRTSENPHNKSSIKKLNEMIEKEVFSLIKEKLEEEGLTLVKKEKEPNTKEHDHMSESEVDEAITMAGGNIATYTTKLSTPRNMKKHLKNMLPTGYKYR